MRLMLKYQLLERKEKGDSSYTKVIDKNDLKLKERCILCGFGGLCLFVIY